MDLFHPSRWSVKMCPLVSVPCHCFSVLLKIFFMRIVQLLDLRVYTDAVALCCRRTGRREGQVPPGHRRTGFHVHRTHWVLRSSWNVSRGGFASLCSSTFTLLLSSFLHISLSSFITTQLCTVDSNNRQPLTIPGYATNAFSFHALSLVIDCQSAVLRHKSNQAFVFHETSFSTKHLIRTTVAACEIISSSPSPPLYLLYARLFETWKLKLWRVKDAL